MIGPLRPRVFTATHFEQLLPLKSKPAIGIESKPVVGPSRGEHSEILVEIFSTVPEKAALTVARRRQAIHLLLLLLLHS